MKCLVKAKVLKLLDTPFYCRRCHKLINLNAFKWYKHCTKDLAIIIIILKRDSPVFNLICTI